MRWSAREISFVAFLKRSFLRAVLFPTQSQYCRVSITKYQLRSLDFPQAVSSGLFLKSSVPKAEHVKRVAFSKMRRLFYF